MMQSLDIYTDWLEMASKCFTDANYHKNQTLFPKIVDKIVFPKIEGKTAFPKIDCAISSASKI